ncbi:MULTISPECIES: hypothetical protein [Bacillus]|uniref:hypothetical protein n=1 Tax=Bacillus TaxID=1386 RepID=UPI0007008B6C|nr:MULTISPECIES: hypothetical protein [Bacillus]KQU15361.1 hypothetical protein ASG46_00335 [Bacillus sp. Leaf49]MCS3483193.1 hypothetical protein [Bacillus sp. JUb11]MCY7621068.1 hypothetical protein [Bacillus altitudinis]MDI6562600.1 hypothetical protein [Bacillus altitudinis]MDI6646388.1 hypothetical protein [Bacillus altitudinis]
MRKIVEGDWVEALGEVNRRMFHISGYVVKISEYELLVKPPKGKSTAVPKHWAKNLDVTITKDELKALIDLSLDLNDEHLFRMCVRDLQAFLDK